MKFKNFVYLSLACAAFAACNSKDYVSPSTDPSPSDGDAFLAVNILASNDDPATKAGNFESGDAAESEVTSARFYFFDADGQAVAVNSGGTNYIDVDGIGVATQGGNGSSVSHSYPTVLVIDGQKVLPAYMITFLNPPRLGFGRNQPQS